MNENQMCEAIRTSSRPLATEYTVMLDRDIAQPEYWHEEFFTMRSALEGDVVNVHVNTVGGCVGTISAFQSIKQKSSAHFHGILEGVGYSAGSAMFLLCDTHEVSDFAEMMIHTAQGGYGGSSQGVAAQGGQMSRSASILVNVVYKDFLTEEEIKDVLKGAELWLDAEEIRERLTIRERLRLQRNVEETKKDYTIEKYAEEVLMDLVEDCNTFSWDVSEVISNLATLTSPVELDEGSTQLELDFGEESQTLLEFIQSEMNIENLKLVAQEYGISIVHNAKLETIRKKLIDSGIAE